MQKKFPFLRLRKKKNKKRNLDASLKLSLILAVITEHNKFRAYQFAIKVLPYSKFYLFLRNWNY